MMLAVLIPGCSYVSEDGQCSKHLDELYKMEVSATFSIANIS
jgi:hypothetical protein